MVSVSAPSSCSMRRTTAPTEHVRRDPAGLRRSGRLILALVGLPFLLVQLRELQRSVQGNAHAAMYAQAALDRFCRHALARRPVLRRRLAENRESYSHALQYFFPESTTPRSA